MTTLPTWAVWLISFGSPGAAVIGATFGPLLLRRGATELEVRSRRELLVQQMTWAAELAIDPDPRKARLGVSHLADLADSDLADDDTARFVRTTMNAVIADARDRTTEAGEAAEVLRFDEVDPILADPLAEELTDLSSDQDRAEEVSGDG